MVISVGKKIFRRLPDYILAFLSFTYTHIVYAQAGPSNINIAGSLYEANGAAVTAASVNFKIEIYDKAGACLLYSEDHLGVNLSQTKGGFSLEVGKGSSIQNLIDSTSPTAMTSKVYENNGAVAGGWAGCPSGTTLSTGDERMIRVHYNLGGGYITMTPDVPMASTAYAMVAETLQGKRPSDFIQVHNDATNKVTQANVENVFSSTNYPKLTALLAGSSGDYIPATPTSSVGFNNQRLINVATPTASTDAATKGYADANLGGKTVDVSGVGPATGNGHTLIWDQATQKWTTGVPTSTDNTKLPLAGGTMTGAITMGGFDILGTGHITMSPLKTITLGNYTTAQETTLVGTLTAANKGASWFNSTTNKLMVWDGSAAVAQSFSGASAGGDLTGTYPNPTIANDKITSAKVDSAGVGINRLVISDQTTGANLKFATCATNEVLRYEGANGWICRDPSAIVTFPVSSVNGKTGAVVLNANDLSLGTAALENVGTAAGNVPQLDAGGKLPSSVIPTLSSNYIVDGGNTRGAAISVGTNDNFALNFRTNNANVMTLDTSGRLGIGTAAPGQQLHVANGSDYVAASPGSNSAFTVLNNSVEAQVMIRGGGTSANFADIAMRSVEATPKTWQIAHKGPGSGGSLNAYMVEYHNGTSWSNPFTITPAGNVGINMTSPQRALHVNGPIRVNPASLPGTPSAGDIAIDSGAGNTLKYYDGSTWQTAGTGGGGQSSTSSLTFNSNSDATGTDGGFNFQANGSNLMTVANNGDTALTSTTASTSSSTGALVVSGGVGVAGNIYSGGNISGGNFTSSGSFTGNNAIFNRAGIGTTPADAVTIQNTTASTAGAPVQMSPRFRLRGSVWDTGAGASQTADWTIENLPVSGNPGSSTLRFGQSYNGSAYTFPMTLTSSGNLTLDAPSGAGKGVLTAGNMTLAPNGYITGVNGVPLTLRGSLAFAATGYDTSIYGSNNRTATSGENGTVDIQGNFQPASGNGNWNSIAIEPTINQSGTASGFARGVYINPTLTAAPSWRALEIASNSGYGIYQSGSSASNYFAGNVGVGTNNPERALHVNGPIRVNPASLPATPSAGDIAIDSGAANSLKYYNGSAWQTVGTGSGSGDFLRDGSLAMTGNFNAGGNQILGNTTASANLDLESTSHATKGYVLLQKNGGNVGIGSTSPTQALDVNGTVKATTFSGSGSGLNNVNLTVGPSDIFFDGATNRTVRVNGNTTSGSKLTIQSGGAGGTDLNGGDLELNSGNVSGSGTSNLVFKTAGGNSSGSTVYSPTTRMTITGTGNVGINTASPARLLHVNGPIRVAPAALPSSPAAGDLAFDSGASNALKFYDGSAWQTVGTGSGSGDFMKNGSVAMTGNFNAGGNQILGNTTASANLDLESTSHATKGYVLLQKNGGNVGVGTSAPAYRFDILDSFAGASGTQSAGHSQMNLIPSAGSTATASGFSPVGNFSGVGNSSGASVFGLNAAAMNSWTGRIGSVVGVQSWVGAVNGGTIDRAIGGAFQVENVGSTITDGYGIYINTVHGSNSHYSLYASDATSPSYFAGSVGVGTATPARSLHVNGPMRLTPAVLPASPAAGDLAFDSGASNALKFYDGSAWQTVGTGTGSGDFMKNGSVAMTGDFNAGGNRVLGNSTASANLELESTSNATKGYVLLQKNGGNVGIGTTSPAQALDVSGTGKFSGGLFVNGATSGGDIAIGGDTANRSIMVQPNLVSAASNGTDLVVGAGRPKAGAADKNGGTLFLVGGTSSGTGVSNIELQTASGGASGGTSSIPTTKMIVTGAGNVGIGTGTPSSLLNVVGGVNTSESILGELRSNAGGAGTGTTLNLVNSTVAGGFAGSASLTALRQADNSADFIVRAANSSSTPSEIMRLKGTSGFVGVGTNAPARLLHVNGPIRVAPAALPSSPAAGDLAFDSGASNALKFYDGSAWQTVGTGSGDFMKNGSVAMTGNFNAGGNSILGNTTASANLTLESTSNATKGHVFIQPNGGFVGIGTTNPLWMLDVNGGIHSSTRVTAVGLTGTAASTFAPLVSHNSGAAADEKYWDLYHTATSFSLRAVNDAYSLSNTAMQFNRSGYTISSVTFPYGNMGIGTTSPASTAKLEVAGALRLSTTSADTYTTPAGSNVPTKISIPIYNPGTYGQIVAMGLPSSADATSRTLSLFDARTGVHQPTFNVFSPDENQYAGLSWDGSNTLVLLKSTTNWGIQAGSNTGLNMLSSNGYVGIGTATPARQLHVNGPMRITPAALPSSPAAGELAFDSGASNALKFYNGSAWQTVTTGAGGGDFMKDGSVAMTGDLNVGGNRVLGNSTASANLELESTSNATKGYVLLNKSGGFVGIGTTTPSAPIHIGGSQILEAGGINTSNEVLRFSASTFPVNFYHSVYSSHSNTDSTLASLQFRLNDTTSVGQKTVMTLNGAGNVGIGTTTISSMLTVNGAIESKTGGIVFPDGSVQTTAATSNAGYSSDLTGGTTITGTFTHTGSGAGGNAALIDNTTTPAADPVGSNASQYFQIDFGAGNTKHIRRLSVKTASTSGYNYPITYDFKWSDDNSSWTTVGSFTIPASTGASFNFDFSASGAHRYWKANYASGTLGGNTWLEEIEMMEYTSVPQLWTANGTDVYYTTGKVGIGTTTPSAKLEVKDGNIATSGTGLFDLGLERVSNTCNVAGLDCTATCSAGKNVVSGGCISSGLAFDQNYPSSATTWYCRSLSAGSITAYAVCGKVVGF